MDAAHRPAGEAFEKVEKGLFLCRVHGDQDPALGLGIQDPVRAKAPWFGAHGGKVNLHPEIACQGHLGYGRGQASQSQACRGRDLPFEDRLVEGRIDS